MTLYKYILLTGKEQVVSRIKKLYFHTNSIFSLFYEEMYGRKMSLKNYHSLEGEPCKDPKVNSFQLPLLPPDPSLMRAELGQLEDMFIDDSETG